MKWKTGRGSVSHAPVFYIEWYKLGCEGGHAWQWKTKNKGDKEWWIKSFINPTTVNKLKLQGMQEKLVSVTLRKSSALLRPVPGTGINRSPDQDAVWEPAREHPWTVRDEKKKNETETNKKDSEV